MGGNDLHLRVSVDGNTWPEALVVAAAGAPVGAVIERGSTADGEYVRFADGTQICTCSATLETASGQSAFLEAAVPFPQSFAAVTSVFLTLDQASDLAGVSGSGPALDHLGNLGLMAHGVSGCTVRLMQISRPGTAVAYRSAQLADGFEEVPGQAKKGGTRPRSAGKPQFRAAVLDEQLALVLRAWGSC